MLLLLKLFSSYFKIGLFGFGGGYSMLALAEHEIVRVNNWMTLADFIDIIAVAEMTPGPIAINSATFVGYRLAGLGGAIIATLGVITPSMLFIIPAAKLFTRFYQYQGVQRALAGIYPAVISLIALAAYIIGQSAIVDLGSIFIACGCGILLLLTRIHPLLIIGLGALSGIAIYL